MSTAQTSGSQLTVIDPKANFLTIINTYVVAPERLDELLDFLTKSADQTLRYVPGFISANFHVSLDRTQIANYSQWKNRQALLDARDSAELADLMQRAGQIATSFAPVMYELRSSIAAS